MTQATATPTLKDTLADALRQAPKVKEDVLDRSEMISLEQMAQLMQVSTEEVLTLSQKGAILALTSGPAGEMRFPSWQIGTGRTPLNGLQEVIELSGSPWQAYYFLMSRPEGLNFAHVWQALDDGWRTQIIAGLRARHVDR
jgi:hypothetical protein